MTALAGARIADLTVEGPAAGRSLRQRLLQPDGEDLTQLSSLLSSAIDARGGECIVNLDGATLDKEHHFEALIDSAVSTDASIPPLSADDRRILLETLRAAAADISCHASLLFDAIEAGPPTTVADVADKNSVDAACSNDAEVTARWRPPGIVILVRRREISIEDLVELRVAVVGNVDSGKSTTLGVLSKGRLDDGRGRARLSLLRHKHEIDTGRTSSQGLEIMGYDSQGRVVHAESHATALAAKDVNAHQGQAARRQALSWTQICSNSTKVVSFIDLAGHERYLKTTLHGLTGQTPNLVTLIVGGNAGLIGMSKEHLSVALALQVPICVVVTKVDMTPAPILVQTLRQLTKILRSPGCRKTPVFVKDAGMAAELAQHYAKEKACPIFLVSNVTGIGLDHLKSFYNCLPAEVEKGAADKPFEFVINETFSVPFVGTVVSGIMQGGRCAAGDNVLLGPDSVGQWLQSSIKSIHRRRVPVESAEAGQSVSFSLKRIRRTQVRKGMVLVAKTDIAPPVTRRFEANILILHHATTIGQRYQAMLHCGPVRQTVRIIEIQDQKLLRTGDRAKVMLEFMSYPEHLRVGQKLLVREGKTKVLLFVSAVRGSSAQGMGIVTRLLPNTATLT